MELMFREYDIEKKYVSPVSIGNRHECIIMDVIFFRFLLFDTKSIRRVKMIKIIFCIQFILYLFVLYNNMNAVNFIFIAESSIRCFLIQEYSF